MCAQAWNAFRPLELIKMRRFKHLGNSRFAIQVLFMAEHSRGPVNTAWPMLLDVALSASTLGFSTSKLSDIASNMHPVQLLPGMNLARRSACPHPDSLASRDSLHDTCFPHVKMSSDAKVTAEPEGDLSHHRGGNSDFGRGPMTRCQSRGS